MFNRHLMKVLVLMRFDYVWESKEYERLYRVLMWHGADRWWNVFTVGMALAVVAYCVTSAGVAAFKGDIATAVLYSLWPTLIAMWFAFVFLRRPRVAARRYVSMHGEAHSVELVEDHVRLATEQVREELSWSVFTRAVETRSFLLLFVGKHALHLPKRAIRDDEQLAAVKRLIRGKLGERADLELDSHVPS
jgi:hypothetical protein